MAERPSPQRAARCPICREPAADTFRPFCSGRCADIDLGRWVSGAYAIPGGTVDDDEDGDQRISDPPAKDESEPGGE